MASPTDIQPWKIHPHWAGRVCRKTDQEASAPSEHQVPVRVCMPRSRQRGVTLIELVVSIVILSVAATGILMVMTQTILSSADPMLREQATAIAQSYMEEILTQPLSDPDGVETNGPEGGEIRATYDDVWDYHGLNNSAGALDQNGATVSGLEGYNIAVSVTGTTLGPGAGSPALRIAITVTHDGQAGINVPVVAYRLN